MLKEEFKNQIVEGIKAGRLVPCGVVGGEVYGKLYWTVENDEVTKKIFSVDDEQPEFRFGISIGAIEEYSEKDFSELSDVEVKRTMLDIVDDYGVDDWYDQYQESLED